MSRHFFTVYLILYENGYLYTGSTANLYRRSREHHKGGFKLKVIYKERHPTREAAYQREHQIKGWSRAKKLALAEGRQAELKHLAKRRAGAPPPHNAKRV
jgi:putative endonuclease